MANVNVGSAYVTIMPDMSGFTSKVKAGMTSSLSSAGIAASSAIGKSFSSGGLTSSIASFTGKAGSALTKMGKVGVGAIAGITAGVVGLAAKGGMTRALNLEQAQQTFKGLKLDWEDYEQTVNDAVKGTAFSLDQAALVAANLAASGVGAGNDMSKALNGCAGMAATFGRDLSDIGGIYQKIAAKGKVSGDELYQLQQRGINITGALADKLGVAEDAVSEMVSNGEVDFQTFSDAMYDAFGDSAQGASETFTGALANVQAALSRIGAKFMTPFEKTSTKVFQSVISALDAISEALDPVVEKFSNFVEKVGSKATTVIDTFTTSLSAGKDPLTAIEDGLNAAFSPETVSNIKTAVTSFALMSASGPALSLMSKGILVGSKAWDNYSTSALTALKKSYSFMTNEVPISFLLLKDKVSNAASTISGKLSSAFSKTLNAVTTKFPRASAVVAASFSAISQGASTVATKISGAFSTITGKVTGVITNVTGSISSVFNNLKTKYQQSNTLMSAITTKISAGFSKIKNVTSTVFGAVATKATSALSRVSATISQKVSGSLAKFRKNGTGAFGALTTLGSKFGKGMTMVTGALGALSIGLLALGAVATLSGVDFESITAKVTSGMEELANNLPVVMGQLSTWLASFLTQIVTLLPGLVSAFASGISSLAMQLPTLLSLLVEALSSLIIGLLPTFVELVPTLLDAGVQLFLSLIDALVLIFPELMTSLLDVIMSVGTFLVENLPTLLDAAFTLFMAIVQGVMEMLPNLISYLPTLIISVTSTLISYIPRLLSSALQLFMAIVKAVPSVLGSLKSAISELIQAGVQAVKDKVSDFVQAGKDLINGAINGITDAGQWIGEKVREICANAKEAIKNFFHLGSPSKLMREMFGYVGEGMVLGLADQQKAIVDQALSIAEGVAEALDIEGSSTWDYGASATDAYLSNTKHSLSSAQSARTYNVWINGESQESVQNAIASFFLELERLGVMNG